MHTPSSNHLIKNNSPVLKRGILGSIVVSMQACQVRPPETRVQFLAGKLFVMGTYKRIVFVLLLTHYHVERNRPFLFIFFLDVPSGCEISSICLVLFFPDASLLTSWRELAMTLLHFYHPQQNLARRCRCGVLAGLGR